VVGELPQLQDLDLCHYRKDCLLIGEGALAAAGESVQNLQELDPLIVAAVLRSLHVYSTAQRDLTL
jgi:hypothetical protein